MKPDLRHLRQPGCWAIVHIMKEDRSKLDARAKYVRFVGYDVPRNCWVFVDPKSGRKIRTIHATFFERRRDPHEHVDVSDMILIPPNLNHASGDTKPLQTYWKCQLWPTHHWPGRDIEGFDDPIDLDDWNPDKTTGLKGAPKLKSFDMSRDDIKELENKNGPWKDQSKDYINDPSLYNPTFPGNVLHKNPDA